MNGWYIAAVALSILSIVICITQFIMPNRKYSLIIRFTFDIVKIACYVCIYMYLQDKVILAMVASGVVGAVRDVIFLYRDKYKWADSIIWLFAFSAALIVFSILEWSSWLTLLPIIGTIINTIALYLKDYKKMKMVVLVGQIFFITYHAVLIPESDLIMILNLIVSVAYFMSALIGLIIYFTHRSNPQNAQ
ncbi:MAG: YgjV family protein [Bacilli bacterium]|nr:YgjV family protein [Bacilli bacterium]